MMKRIFKALLFSLPPVLPVLYLTATALSALATATAVFFGVLLMFGVSFLVPKIVPENVKFPVTIISCATAVSVVQLTLLPLLAGLEFSGFYMPLCCVSAYMLFFESKKSEDRKQNAFSLLANCGAFAAVCILLGVLRELIGSGSLFGLTVTEHIFEPMRVLSLPAGAIFIVAVVCSVFSYFSKEDAHD